MNDDTSMADGIVIEGFSALRRIGQGGYSTVYRAQQDGMGRDVAVKVLNASIEDDDERRAFLRECELMGSVADHPNIANVFQPAFTSDGRPCIVMQLYEGNYRDRVSNGTGLDVAEVMTVGIAVGEALAHVHAQGISHRDVKPHNIFVHRHGPVLADFGISSVDTEQTSSGAAGFSVQYSAPEVLESGTTGVAADIYALGASLFHLADGRAPFAVAGANSLSHVMHRIMTKPAPRLARTKECPQLGRLLHEALAKDVSSRPRSATEFVERLRRISTGDGGGSQGDGTFDIAISAPVSDPRAPAPQPSGPRYESPSVEGGLAGAEDAGDPETVTIAEPALVDDSAVSIEEIEEDRAATAGPRQVVLLVAVVTAIAVLAVGGWALLDTGPGEDEPTTPTLDVDTAFFDEVPVPTGVATTVEARSVTVEWRVSDDSLTYAVSRAGSDEVVTVDAPPVVFVELPPGTHCFEVAAVNEFLQRSEPTPVNDAGCATVE
ncbi:MAG: hypothetical protein DHS20C19_27450 [Acidimicrobiales bacterium]|nr:MAG: hypothetical protein DHS20C19_27450 [Acidimicrobiales bacterium]